MKLQAQSSRELNLALGKSSKCLAGKNTIAILDNVLLTQNEEGKFFFTSSTSDSQLIIPAPLTVIEGKFDKPVVLPVKTITQFLATLPDCSVTFDIVDKRTLSLEYCTTIGDKIKSGKVSLVYSDGEEFPQMRKPSEESLHISLPGGVFREVIEKARSFIVADEIRPVLNGLCIDVADDLAEVVFVATSGHSLFKRTLSNNPAKGGADFYRSGNPAKMLIHIQYFRPLSVFANFDQIEVESDGHIIRISSGDTEFMCKAIEGRYPNYNSVIPRDNPYFINFDKKEMNAVLRRVAMFSSESSNMIELKKDGLFLKVFAQDIDFGLSADDEVIINASNCMDNFRIGFKASSLIDVINAIDGDIIRMALSDPTRAGVVTADEPSPQILTLVMPMILED